jgi:hypothetical protein
MEESKLAQQVDFSYVWEIQEGSWCYRIVWI